MEDIPPGQIGPGYTGKTHQVGSRITVGDIKDCGQTWLLSRFQRIAVYGVAVSGFEWAFQFTDFPG
jgi:hypothetical protein